MGEVVKKKVLVIDDESVIRSLINQILYTEFTIYEAENGVQAVKLIETDIPDIIVLDIKMPEMNGYSFLSYLREEKADLKIPVVMISANDHMLNKVLGTNLGVVAYIEKPFSTETLVSTVKKYAGN